MHYYSANTIAIDSMHQHGYTDDFQLKGNDLLWIQGKVSIPVDDFMITDRYHTGVADDKGSDIILGITSHSYGIRGILILRYASLAGGIPASIINKLQEMYVQLKPMLPSLYGNC